MRSGGFGFDRQFGFTAPAHEAAAPVEESGGDTRITETGDTRITEAGDTRVLETA